MKPPVVLINDYEVVELKDDELLAVIEYIEKESVEGVDAMYGIDRYVPYEQVLVFGGKAMELMEYSKYAEEAKKRGIKS
jgi:hypothetical protein